MNPKKIVKLLQDSVTWLKKWLKFYRLIYTQYWLLDDGNDGQLMLVNLCLIPTTNKPTDDMCRVSEALKIHSLVTLCKSPFDTHFYSRIKEVSTDAQSNFFNWNTLSAVELLSSGPNVLSRITRPLSSLSLPLFASLLEFWFWFRSTLVDVECTSVSVYILFHSPAVI